MPNDQLLDRLVEDLRPVRRRRAETDAIIMAALGGVQLALVLCLGVSRPDIASAMTLPSFWWKLASLGAIAIAAVAAAILSFDPAASPRRGLRWIAVLVVVSLASGLFAGTSGPGLSGLGARLNWPEGIQCVIKIVVLSLPAIFGLGLLMRRGAPTEPGGTALAVGIAAAAWGAFVFVFACPHDDPLYIAVWYTVGCGMVTVLARLLLPLLTRW